ncbi:MAG: rhomboid family intramembrane serine protease [Syntrophomonadaceae bacterium]|nr:rhomboid family intramembrane serine protease [Syntrophomonadaceae bacterium]
MIPLRDSTHSASFPMVTVGLIILNFVIFISQLSLGAGEIEQMLETWGLTPFNFASGQSDKIAYSTFISYMFLHGGWMHLLGNMWSLWLFGDNLEDKMGKLRFFFFYIICGIIAALVHYAVFPNSHIPVIGASGAVAGIMGAYFLMFKRARVFTYIPPLFFVNLPAWIFLGFWILSQIWGGTFAVFGVKSYSNVAFWAHIGGFAAGMILYRAFLKSDKEEFFES